MISILESTCEQKKKGLVHATHRDGPHQQVNRTRTCWRRKMKKDLLWGEDFTEFCLENGVQVEKAIVVYYQLRVRLETLWLPK